MNADQVLQGVIQQFGERMACLRELIQNSIDADTNRIDIYFEEEEDYFVVALEDYGCGMTLEQIDKYLLNVFKSSKEDDLESIGRFGIGFVSIFALKPAYVVVDSSRDDEHTRIVIDADLGIEYFHAEPRVGTRVALYLTLSGEKERDAFYDEALEFMDRSCRYVHIELVAHRHGQESSLTIPLELDLPYTAEVDEPGTEIRVGFGATPSYVLMNRRLVLKQETQALLPGVTVLASSRDIEHNLARKDVIQDEGLVRFMARLRRLVEEELLPSLLEALEKREQSDALIAAGFVIQTLGREANSAFRAIWKIDFLPTMEGGRSRLRSLAWVLAQAERKTLLVTSKATPLVASLSDQLPVLLSTEDWPVQPLLQGYAGLALVDAESVLFAPTVPRAERRRLQPLREATLDFQVRRFEGGHAHKLLAYLPPDEELVLQAESAQGPAPQSDEEELALNVGHPLVPLLAQVANERPALARTLLFAALHQLGVPAVEAKAEEALDDWLEEHTS